MFVLLIDRHGSTHIIDYVSHSQYKTICGSSFYKKRQTITLAADNTFPGICPNCKKWYDDMYVSDLEYQVRFSRGNSNRLKNLHDFCKMGFLDPADVYGFYCNRIWLKLTKYKTLKNRHKKFYD